MARINLEDLRFGCYEAMITNLNKMKTGEQSIMERLNSEATVIFAYIGKIALDLALAVCRTFEPKNKVDQNELDKRVNAIMAEFFVPLDQTKNAALIVVEMSEDGVTSAKGLIQTPSTLIPYNHLATIFSKIDKAHIKPHSNFIHAGPKVSITAIVIDEKGQTESVERIWNYKQGFENSSQAMYGKINPAQLQLIGESLKEKKINGQPIITDQQMKEAADFLFKS